MASYNGTDSSQCVSEQYLLGLKKEIGKEWKDVGRCLGFSNAELDHFDEDNNKNVQEAIYQMLLCWKRKSGARATYANLKKALVRSKGRMLPEDSLSHSSDKKEVLISYLKKTYAKWLGTVRPNPMKKAQKWKLEDLFMDLGIALLDQTYSSNEQGSWKSLKTYTALFEHPELNVKDGKIIIEGDPGSGKTFLMLYLAYLWCNNDKIMEGVKLFILLPLRRVKPGTSIGKVIMDVLLRASGGELKDTDIQCILRNESCMILALDGLDEYPGLEKEGHQHTGVMEIIREESEYVSPDVKVILTTRPSGLPYIHDCDVKRVKLERLQDVHRETYLKKVFPAEEDEAERRLILETIDANYFIKDYCELPLWFTLIVQIMRDDLQRKKGIKLGCLSEFFKYILEGLRGHFVNKGRQDQMDIDSPKLAEIAFNGLLKESLKHIWNKQELADVEKYNTLVEIGTLVEEEDLDSDFMYSDASMAPKTVTFLHKTFQEWYGAKYFAELSETPDSFTQKLKQAMQSVNTSYLLYFTCGISPKAAKGILNYYLLKGNECLYNYSFPCQCILEYNGEECELKEIIAQLCKKEETSAQPRMFTLSSRDDTLLLKSKLAVFRLAYKLKITIKHIDLHYDDMTCSPPDKIMMGRNIEIPLLSAEAITVHKCYGQPFFNFLRKCDNFKTLRIHTDTFPGTPQEIRQRLQGLKIEVFWKIRNPLPGALRENNYLMKDNEWEFVKEDFYRDCRNCRKPIVGLFWECRNCSSFYLCDACKDKGFHKNHTHRLGREFDEKRLPTAGTPAELHLLKLPFVKMFIYHIFGRCSSCRGKIYGSRFASKQWRGRTLCETCYEGRRNSSEAFEEIKEPRKFKLRRCENCKVTGDMNKVWFRCDTCDCFLLCERCKDEEFHGEHNFIKQYFRDVNCNECGIDTVLLYRCNTCGGRNLCILCQAKAHHKEHEIEEIEAAEKKHDGFRCSSCQNQICGIRYKCTSCIGTFNICKTCKDKGVHSEQHSFEDEKWMRKCHYCFTEVNGPGFKCKKCTSYALCESCYNKGIHINHELKEIHEEEGKCSRCYRNIFGPSFQCESCNILGYSTICEDCKLILTNDNNCNHEFVELRKRDVQHKYIHCNLCKTYQFRGTRYRCKTCKWYNLCEHCKESGHHKHHEFDEWKTSQFLPGPGNYKTSSLHEPWSLSGNSLLEPSRLPIYGML